MERTYYFCDILRPCICENDIKITTKYTILVVYFVYLSCQYILCLIRRRSKYQLNSFLSKDLWQLFNVLQMSSDGKWSWPKYLDLYPQTRATSSENEISLYSDCYLWLETNDIWCSSLCDLLKQCLNFRKHLVYF